MQFKPPFAQFEAAIISEFEQAKSEAGADADGAILELTDDEVSSGAASRASFSILGPKVTITWAGIASLWAACQAITRLYRMMFEASRAKADRVDTSAGTVGGEGMLYLDVAKQLISLKGPPIEGQAVRWVDVPLPDFSAPHDTDAGWANLLFLAALRWIMRHELAHLTLKHDARQPVEQKPNNFYEAEADHEATEWTRRNLRADQARPLGSIPTTQEVQLERRAMSVAFGLLWVAMFEAEIAAASPDHPPIKRRISSSLDQFQLRHDSICYEALAMMLKAWLSPQDEWPRAENAHDALQDALYELQQYMAQFRR